MTAPIAEDKTLAIGAVIAFENPAEAEPSGVAQVRLHRVVSIDVDGRYVTAGDANADLDSATVGTDQIIGQARVHVRLVGLPVFWLTHGDLLPFTVWAALTLGALISAALGFPNRHVAPHKPRSTAPRLIGRAVTSHGALAILGMCGIGILVGAVGLDRRPRDGDLLGADPHRDDLADRSRRHPHHGASHAVRHLRRDLDRGRLGEHVGPRQRRDEHRHHGHRVQQWRDLGSIDKNNQVAKDAKTDALVLAAAIAARTSTARAGALSGTITPGTYRSSGTSFTIASSITLNAGGDSSAIFVFTAASLSVAANATVNLTNGAQAKNVYWRIAGAVTLGPRTASRREP